MGRIGLRELRLARGMTQRQVSHRSGVSDSQLRDMEQGVRGPDPAMQAALARVYGVSVEEIGQAWQQVRERALAGIAQRRHERRISAAAG